MRELLTGLVLASCLLPIAAAGMRVSSYLADATAPREFADLNREPLWSSEVRRVDSSLHAYERLPAVLPESTLVAEAKREDRGNAMLGSANEPEVANGQISRLTETVAAKAREWCGARYRSYDPADNTYQPYGGGLRRTCSAPIEATTVPDQEVARGSTREPNTHERRCMERYSSYRIDDNTYQPYSGGRKLCLGQTSESASNAMGTGGAIVAEF